MTTLTVTIGEGECVERETVRRVRAVESGADVDDDRPILDFADYETLSRFLMESNFHLLDAIARVEPPSIRQTARFVDRDYREVYRNLSTLESLGVVRFEGDGNGTAKKPIVRYDAIEISPSLGESPPAGTPATSWPTDRGLVIVRVPGPESSAGFRWSLRRFP